jgi:hypothetical protein
MRDNCRRPFLETYLPTPFSQDFFAGDSRYRSRRSVVGRRSKERPGANRACSLGRAPRRRENGRCRAVPRRPPPCRAPSAEEEIGSSPLSVSSSGRIALDATARTIAGWYRKSRPRGCRPQSALSSELAGKFLRRSRSTPTELFTPVRISTVERSRPCAQVPVHAAIRRFATAAPQSCANDRFCVGVYALASGNGGDIRWLTIAAPARAPSPPRSAH